MSTQAIDNSTSSAADTVTALRARFGDSIGPTLAFRDEISVAVPAADLVAICRFLKDECAFDMLTDLSGVDNFGDEPRYEVAYLVYSLQKRCRLRLKVAVSEDAMHVPSVASVWRTANWHERETFDMYGIRFDGHPDLTRILMWEGYPYYPLRKDFPLAGLPADLPATAENAGRVESAPMLGGPFVPGIGRPNTVAREPRQYDTMAEQTTRSK